jgi:hypothetical protein
LGVLRSSTPALYGAPHLFSILQHALKGLCTKRLRLTTLVRAVLHDWRTLLEDIHTVPAKLHTLVPTPPSIIAMTDASQHGMGGVWSPLCSHHPEHCLWRSTFPPHIQENLVTSDNPNGSLSINDLELAALIVGASLAAITSAHTHHNVMLGSDNTAACAWLNRGSTTSASANAFLLHQLAFLRRSFQFALSATYIFGASNIIADCCSRLFHLSDSEFLAHMNELFPVKPSWTLVTPPNDLLYCMNSALSKQLQPLASPPNIRVVPKPHGMSGLHSVKTCIATHSSPVLPTPSPSYKYSPTGTAMAPWLPAALQLNLEQWKMPFAPWARRSPHWDALTPASNPLVN